MMEGKVFISSQCSKKNKMRRKILLKFHEQKKIYKQELCNSIEQATHNHGKWIGFFSKARYKLAKLLDEDREGNWVGGVGVKLCMRHNRLQYKRRGWKLFMHNSRTSSLYSLPFQYLSTTHFDIEAFFLKEMRISTASPKGRKPQKLGKSTQHSHFPCVPLT